MSDEIQKASEKLEIRKLEFLEKQMEFFEKAQKRKSLIRLGMGAFLGSMAALALFALFLRPIPAENKDVVIALVSGLTGAFFGAVINFYFGDSDGRLESPVSPQDISKPVKKIDDSGKETTRDDGK